MNRKKILIIVGLAGAALLAAAFLLPIIDAECYQTTPDNAKGYVASGMNLAQGWIVPDENAGLGGGTHHKTLPRNYIIFLALPLLALLAAICLFVKGMYVRLLGCLAGLGGIAFCITGYFDFSPPISNDYTWTWGPGYGLFIAVVGGIIIIIFCGILAWLDWKREKQIEKELES